MSRWKNKDRGFPGGYVQVSASTTFKHRFFAEEEQKCAKASFCRSVCKIFKTCFAASPHTGWVSVHNDDILDNLRWTSEQCGSVTALCLWVASFVLQGPGGAEEVLSPDPSQSQQPGVQHSFVQELFQAQYKWVSLLDIPHSHLPEMKSTNIATLQMQGCCVLVTRESVK